MAKTATEQVQQLVKNNKKEELATMVLEKEILIQEHMTLIKLQDEEKKRWEGKHSVSNEELRNFNNKIREGEVVKEKFDKALSALTGISEGIDSSVSNTIPSQARSIQSLVSLVAKKDQKIENLEGMVRVLQAQIDNSNVEK